MNPTQLPKRPSQRRRRRRPMNRTMRHALQAAGLLTSAGIAINATARASSSSQNRHQQQPPSDGRLYDGHGFRAADTAVRPGRDASSMTQTAAPPRQPLDARRAAAHLVESTGLAVVPADIETLVDSGDLEVADSLNGTPTYTVADLADIADIADGSRIRDVVNDRISWCSHSRTIDEVAARIDVPAIALQEALERSSTPPRQGRIAHELADQICDNTGLGTEIRARIALDPNSAARWLGVRRSDFDHLVDGGLLKACRQTPTRIGHDRRDVPLYAVGDLDRGLADTRLPWTELRATQANDRSPLLDLISTRPSRPHTMQTWAEHAEHDLGVGFLVEWCTWTQHWLVAWDTYAAGAPSLDDVSRHLAYDETARDAGLTPETVRLGSSRLQRVWWARHMLKPRNAVILDTETTSLDEPDIVEIAVIDAATGRTRLHTRVRPTLTVEPAAAAVHGMPNDSLADAPPWKEVLPKLRKITGDRQILAWNAPFDQDAVTTSTSLNPRRLQLQHLADHSNWTCLMEATMHRLGHWSLLPLGGPHDALSDCHTARERLQALAEDPLSKGANTHGPDPS